MARSSDSVKARQWQRRMRRFERSRQSVARFCRDEQVSVPSFYQWRKKLRELGETTGQAEQLVRFRPVQLVASSSLAIRLPGGTHLDVPTADPQVLQLVIQTLAQADVQRTAGGEPC